MMKKLLVVLTLTTGCMIFVVKPWQKTPFLSVVGFVKMADGLGRQCPDLIEVLKDEFSIGFIPLAKSRFEDVQASILPIIKHPNKKLGKVVFFNDNPWRAGKRSLGALEVFKNTKHGEQIRICYTMLESSCIPQKWVEILNAYFDLVVVPDPFLVPVFAQAGVSIPIFTLPLGLELGPFLKAPIKQTYHRVFRFGSLGLLEERKNQIKLITAFDLAFGKNPDVELLIHTRHAHASYKQDFLQVLKKLDNPQIIYHEGSLDRVSYLELFKTLDLLVNVSKGEGYSIQPREAMALGIPCLLSDNTAQSTLVAHTKTITLPTPYQVPCYYRQFNQIVGFQFDFDTEELAERFKQAYACKDELLLYNQLNRAYVEQFDYAQIKKLYRNLVSPPHVKLGFQNRITEEGLETTSFELKEKYQRLTGALL